MFNMFTITVGTEQQAASENKTVQTTDVTQERMSSMYSIQASSTVIYSVGQKSKPAYFRNNFVYCQPIFIIFGRYTPPGLLFWPTLYSQTTSMMHHCQIYSRATHSASSSDTYDTRCRNRQHKLTPFFRRRFLLRVSCISGTRFVWYQIPAPIRTLFYTPESGVQ